MVPPLMMTSIAESLHVKVIFRLINDGIVADTKYEETDEYELWVEMLRPQDNKIKEL